MNTLVNKKKKKKTKQEELEKTQEEWEKKHYAKELKKVEKFLIKLEEDINRLEKHCYRDDNDLDYKGIRQIENLFHEVNKDYYKPIKIKGTFNNNYIQYENRGDKDKGLSVRKHLYMIMPDLEYMINNHKTLMRDSNGIIKRWPFWRMGNSVNNANQFCLFFRPWKKSYNGLKKWQRRNYNGYWNRIYYWGSFRIW